MKKLYIPLIAFICFAMNTNAQEKSKKEKKGDKYYFVYSFDDAIDAYTHTKDLTVDGQRKLADSYHQMHQHIQSEVAYSKLVSTSGGNLPEDYYNYAMVLRCDAKYDESNKWMDKFVEQKPTDLRAKDYVLNKSKFNDLVADQGAFKINHLDINTDARDFGASYYKEKVVFASSRATPKMIQRKSNRDGLPYLNIYEADVKDNQLKNADDFDKSINGKMNDGPASFTTDGNYMAFTRNTRNVAKGEKIVNLEIYFRTAEDKKWSKPVPFFLNNKDYSVGHPCLTAKGDTMYFTSNMPGGFGKADIYRTTKDAKGEWTKPENLGNQINTEGDEMFPFYNGNMGALFFSSNGRYGLGGLDVFVCSIRGQEVNNVYNVGAPVNTQNDDFAAVIDHKTKKGYFSSNRAGGKGSDDMYTVDLLKDLNFGKRIIGIAKDKTDHAIPLTFITLLDDKGNVLDTITTKDDGAYSFSVASDKNFKLNGKKEKYMEGNSSANSFGKDLIIKTDVLLTMKEEKIIVPKMEVGDDLGKVVEFNPVYYDFHEHNIRPDAQKELDKIVKVLNENPSMAIELSSHTDCRASKAYNMKLSNQRSKSASTYIKSRISNPNRVTSKGYGETKLVNGCSCEGTVVAECSEENHQKNRRTEFIITKK
jgi:outer membrane protein OmpA-like peptidoglycan-associated protein/tetratricopeptide (TPR) repeat protein